MAYRSIGLDIGTSAVRAAELTVVDGQRPILEGFGQVGLRPDAMNAGEIQDPGQVVHAIRQLWREGGFTDQRVRVGVAGLRAITREIEMPLLPPDEMQTAVRYQADEVIPFPIDQTTLSSKVIAQISDPESPPRLRVLVAAAHTDLVDSVVAVVTEAGLDPVAIDLQTAALARTFYDPRFAGGPEAIISVGAGLTMVVVHQGGVLQFVRTLDLAGESITDTLASVLGIPHADAEWTKRRLGVQASQDPRAELACEEAVDELVTEIQNSIRFFASLPGRQGVARILLTGAGARAPGLFSKLRSGGIPTIAGSPLSAVDASSLPLTPDEASEVDAVIAASVGLALPDPTGRPFNLLPPSVAQRRAQTRLRKRLFIAATGVAVLLAGLSVWKVLSVNHAESQLSAIVKQNNTIKTVEIPKYDKAVALRDKVESQSSLVIPTLSQEVDWLVVLNQIAAYIPTSATLSQLDLSAATTPGQSSSSSSSSATGVSGSVVGTISTQVVTATLSDVTTWGQSMSQSPIFTNVDLSSGITQGGSVSFSATLDITKGANSQRISEYSVPSK